MHGETVVDARRLFITPGGEEIILGISASPVICEKGKIIGATTILRDQSIRIEFEKQQRRLLERERHIAETLEQAVIPRGDFSVPKCRKQYVL